MGTQILITDNDLGDSTLEADLLREALDAEVTVAACRSEADVISAVEQSQPDAIIVQWAPITEAVLEAAPRLKMISRLGIGIDMIDVAAAKRRNIEVRNVQTYCLEEVASHAVSMGLSLWRRLPQLDGQLRDGTWDAASLAPSLKRLSNATVGLIGLGRIGRLVADAYSTWGARVIVVDPVDLDTTHTRVDLETLAKEADIISLHAPLVPDTYHIIDAEFLQSVREGVVIVNTSRGALINTVDLTEALHAGKVAGAGLDVFEEEPVSPDHPIFQAPNTVLTPHAAWASADALVSLRELGAQNVIDFFTQ